MYNVKSSVSVEECEFIGNSAHQGGAIYNDESDATIADCVFTENLADDNGGALYAFRNRPYLENCVFIMNSADYGGGAVCFHDSDPNLTNCTFRENSADYGGGMYNMGSDPVLTNCLFMANSGHGYGGGMYNTDSNPMLNNCLMTANRAYSYGGALSCNNSDLTVTNCTFTENSAPKGTSIAFNSRDQRGRSTAGLIACIIWDGAEAFWINDRSGIAISYSNIQGGWPGEGNIDSDPLFVDADGPDHIPGTQDDDFRLAPLSPCIDAGDPSYAPEPNKKDLDGNPRIVGGRVDVGTYEFRGIIYVGSDVSDNPFRYGTEDNPFGSIQQAIDIAKDGHTVMVKPGVYGKIDFRGKAITVTGAEGAAVIEEPWNGRGGDPKPDAVTFHTGEGSASVLKNFIIKDAGMAISLNSGSSPTMRNLTIVDNDFGIAAYENSNPDISNCIFWNNRDGDLFQCTARFSSLEGGAEGEGNITVNPLFVEEAGGDYHSDGDYHLKSEGHRWDQDAQIWIYDRVTSRCIDAGDPACPLGDEPMSVPRDADNEFGINRRINMGAFGGTAQASMPPLDLVSPEYETVAPGPNPALWALNGTPHEAPGASGTWGYRWVQMTAAEATDNSGWVEYFFDCTTQSELSSGWQYSRDYEVRVGGPGLGHRFRVKTRDLFGNETGWSELLEAK
jgi:parallel beta-helix repeat protein/predicted outer membrane repeat protein